MLTPLQHRIITFIKQYINQYTYSPSLVEVATGIGISANSISLISRNIHALVKIGKLKFAKQGYRNIQIIESETQFNLPLLGYLTSNSPVEMISEKSNVNLSSHHYLLQAKDNSMQDEGIFSGDFVIYRPSNNAEEGEIVIASVDEKETLVKRLSYKIPERITLISANANLKPKAYLSHRIKIQGVYVGLLRLSS